MPTKNELKYYSSLLHKKYRSKEGKFLVEGEKLVMEGLKSDYECERILVSSHYFELNREKLSIHPYNKFRIEQLTEKEFEKISDTKSPQGIAAIFIKKEKNLQLTSSLIIALENISDPGNLGTIIRNCDWFGVKELILSGDCADLYNPKVIRSSMGSIFHLITFIDDDFHSTIDKLNDQGYRLLCADLNGSDLFQLKPVGEKIIIFCNESKGPSQQLLSLVDEKITIPKLGNAESLNVASASAVILAEITKEFRL